MPNSFNLAFILLAAGQGSRLGFRPKALLKKESNLDSQTLLAHFAHIGATLNAKPFLVVTGFYHDQIEALAPKFAHCVRNFVDKPNADLSQGDSARIALENLPKDFDAVVIALVDQAQIGVAEIRALQDAFIHRPAPCEVVLPVMADERGNPVILSRKAVELILAKPGLTPREWMDQHPDLVFKMNSKNRAYFDDVDTPDDLERYGLRF